MELNKREVKIDPSIDLNDLGKLLEDTPNLTPQEPEPPKLIDNKAKVKEWLKMAKIDPLEKIERPPVCLSIIDGEHEGIIGTLGNFSLIIGKAKSKKTFSLSLFLSALVANQTVFGKFKGSLPENKTKVVFFDTEQGRYHVDRVYRRICKLIGIDNPVNFETYCLRQFTALQRLEIIDYKIQTDPDIGFVAIDGIRDLVSSINDIHECNEVLSYLLRWTEQKHIHLMTIIHQNKGDFNARGHLGTELVNKAETVLAVARDPQDRNISTVEPSETRDREPEPFAFTVDENGLPVLVDGWEKVEATTKKAVLPDAISDDYHKEKLKGIFKDLGDHVKGGELKDCIKTVFELGDSKAIQFRAYYLSENWIIRNGHPNDPKVFYTLNI